MLKNCNLSSSTRFESITINGAERISVEGSLATSRLDLSKRQKQALSILGGEGRVEKGDTLNEKALKVIRRVQDKLAGTDYQTNQEVCDLLDVQDQVQRLIVQATSTEKSLQTICWILNHFTLFSIPLTTILNTSGVYNLQNVRLIVKSDI